MGLGLQTVAERTCSRSKLCGTGASDSCGENMQQKQALWEGLGRQAVAERKYCRSKLFGTGASDNSVHPIAISQNIL